MAELIVKVMPIDEKENWREDEQLQHVHDQRIEDLNDVGEGLVHISEPGQDFPRLSGVKKAEIKRLDMLVETRLIIIADIHPYTLGEISAQELAAADCDGHNGAENQRE